MIPAKTNSRSRLRTASSGVSVRMGGPNLRSAVVELADIDRLPWMVPAQRGVSQLEHTVSPYTYCTGENRERQVAGLGVERRLPRYRVGDLLGSNLQQAGHTDAMFTIHCVEIYGDLLWGKGSTNQPSQSGEHTSRLAG